MDEVERYIRNLPDGELVDMVRNDFDQYTDGALRIARDELIKRGLPEKDEALAACQSGDAEDGAGEAFAAGAHGLIGAFLNSEIRYQESYDAISQFVSSMNIRSGEYEGEQFVIRKMDRDNFILYSERVLEHARAISSCAAIGRQELLERIDRKAAEVELTVAGQEME